MKHTFITLAVVLTSIAGCSDKKEEPKDHLWKSQQRAIEKAKEAEEQIKQAFERRKKQVDD